MGYAHRIPDIGDPGVDGNAGKIRLAHVTVGSATTNDVVVGDTAVYTLFAMDEPCVVLGLWTQIETGFTASVTLDIGDTGSGTRLTSDTTIVPGTTGAIFVAGTGLAVPYVYSTAADIELDLNGATVAAGLMSVYLQYALLRD